MNHFAYGVRVGLCAMLVVAATAVCSAATIQLSSNSVYTDAPDFDPQLQRNPGALTGRVETTSDFLPNPNATLAISLEAGGGAPGFDYDQRTLGGQGPNLPAEGNGDGMVGGADFLLRQANYGQGSSAIRAAVAVPEPRTLIGLLLALTLGLAWLSYRRDFNSSDPPRR